MTNDSKITVSIIVPVYNVESYLEQCLDSLVNQTLKNIEIIIVNDGSTDGSGEICDRYADNYPFVKVIHQKNAGASAARKNAMRYINGEYYGFCDSDDFVSIDFYKNLYDAATASNADIAQCDYTMYYGSTDTVAFPDNRTASAVERNNGDSKAVMDVMLLSPSLVVRRIHKTNLTERYNIAFDPEITIAEDLLFSCCTLLVSKKIVYVRQTGYFYRQNREGRLTAIGDERIMDLYWLFDKLNGFICQNNISKPWCLSHLSVNIPLHQLYRVDENLRVRYMDEFLDRLTFSEYFKYVISGLVFSIKMRFVKYFLLNWICAHTLFMTMLFRKNKTIAYPMLKATLFWRQGGWKKRILNKFLSGTKK